MATGDCCTCTWSSQGLGLPTDVEQDPGCPVHGEKCELHGRRPCFSCLQDRPEAPTAQPKCRCVLVARGGPLSWGSPGGFWSAAGCGVHEEDREA